MCYSKQITERPCLKGKIVLARALPVSYNRKQYSEVDGKVIANIHASTELDVQNGQLLNTFMALSTSKYRITNTHTTFIS